MIGPAGTFVAPTAVEEYEEEQRLIPCSHCKEMPGSCQCDGGIGHPMYDDEELKDMTQPVSHENCPNCGGKVGNCIF